MKERFKVGLQPAPLIAQSLIVDKIGEALANNQSLRSLIFAVFLMLIEVF